MLSFIKNIQRFSFSKQCIIPIVVLCVINLQFNETYGQENSYIKTGNDNKILLLAEKLHYEKKLDSAYHLLQQFNINEYQIAHPEDSNRTSIYHLIIADYFGHYHILDSAYRYYTQASLYPHTPSMAVHINSCLFHIAGHLQLHDLKIRHFKNAEKAIKTLIDDESKLSQLALIRLYGLNLLNGDFKYIDSLLTIHNNSIDYQKEVKKMIPLLIAHYPDSLNYFKVMLRKLDTSLITDDIKKILNNSTTISDLQKSIVDNPPNENNCKLAEYESNLFAYQYYKKKNDSIKAFEHLEKAFELSDSIRLTQLYISSIEYELKLKSNELFVQQQKKLAQKETEIIKNRTLMVISIVVCLIMLLSIWLYLKYKQKMSYLHIQQLEEEQKNKTLEVAIQTQQEERKRIAEDIHDSLGVLISAGIMHWQALAKSDKYDKDHDKLNEEGMTIFNEMRTEIRNIAFNLLPENSASQNLVNAVEKLVNRFNTQPAIFFKFFIYGNIIPLNTQRNYVLIRMIEEICNNALKHSQAKNVLIEFYYHENLLHIHIYDDGIGYDEYKSKKGMGIKNLSNRAASINATIEINTMKETGTTIDIQIHYSN